MNTSNTESLFEGIIRRDLRSLSKSITLIESTLSSDRLMAEKLLQKLCSFRKASLRLGVSGPPGVGKSSFIDSFGMNFYQYLHQKNLNPDMTICVLANDPASVKDKGAILGDKTRMLQLSQHPQVYIRPLKAKDQNGGMHQYILEMIMLVEAFGFDLILIETAGVGQTEVAIAEIVDVLLVLMQPASGDELQGIKRGLLEVADYFVVTKSDGEMKNKNQEAHDQLRSALSLFYDSQSKRQIFSTSIFDPLTFNPLIEIIYNQFDKRKEFVLKRSKEWSAYFEKRMPELVWETLLSDDKFRLLIQSQKTQIDQTGNLPYSAFQETKKWLLEVLSTQKK